ncbi:MAG: diguanylate cyclase [Proteobacteria bacterium]|nr:diguanylate cyclase [Pseudomonadota bacterium]
MVEAHFKVRWVTLTALMIAIGMHMWGRGYGAIAWGLLVLQFFAYPYLVFLRARSAIDPRKAELTNLLFDCVLFGVWSAVLDFPVSITYTLLLGATLNNAIIGGWRGAVRSTLYFSAGAVSWILVAGFKFSPQTDLPVTAWCLVGLSIYVTQIGNFVFVQRKKLRDTRAILQREELERKAAQDILVAKNIELQEQIVEIRQLHAQLQDQAMRDSLTGLYNRRYLDETLERELARAKRESYPLSLMMIDLDHFKKVNDTYGHQAGDEVLKFFSGLLNEGARAEDVLCRYGGEEFLLLLPKMPLEVARERAEQWRADFEARTVVVGEQRIQTTLSVGIAAYPQHGATPDQLTQSADLALYLAKSDGRNRVVVFSPQ